MGSAKTPNLIICRARKEDESYINEKLIKYMLDATDATWQKFFVARLNDKTVAFGRIIDHGDFFEIASLGVDYYHRKKGIGKKMLFFLVKEAKRLNPKKPIYGVTHRPGFLEKAGFKEVTETPEPLRYKRHFKCKLDDSRIKIMRIKV